MTKLSGTVRHLDSGFRRNDGSGRHPGESRDPQCPISTRQCATLHEQAEYSQDSNDYTESGALTRTKDR